MADERHEGRAAWLGMSVALAAIALLILWSGPPAGRLDVVRAQAGSGVIRVAPSGSDAAGCGGEAQPCASVQYAVDQAAAGDEIRVAAGTYTGVNSLGGMSQMVYVSKALTIRGGYTTSDWATPDPATNVTTLDAQNAGRVVSIMGPAEVHLEGLRLTNGRATNMGGLYMGSYTCNSAAGRGAGGGVCIQNATVTLDAVRVMTNTASTKGGYGGGVFASGATLTVTHSTIRGNQAGTGGNHAYGGGIALLGGGAVVDGNQILDNKANPNYDGDGGGAYVNDCAATFRDNTIQGNEVRGATSSSSRLGGGGIAVAGAGATITANRIVSNTAPGYIGGGVAWNGGPVTVTANLILSNTAAWGGGIWAGNAPAIVDSNVIAGNTATGHGSAIEVNTYNPNTPAFRHNTIAQNSGGDGSAVYVEDYGRVAFTNTIIADNTVAIGGGWSTTISLNRTLWDGNITDTVTLVNDVGHVTGAASLAADGYHLTEPSAAVDAGTEVGVTTDIDGDPRPRGNAPDIGADESPYARGANGDGVALEISALPSRLMASPRSTAGVPEYVIQQEYLIRMANGLTDTAVSSYAVENALPAALDFAAQTHHPPMAFSNAGGTQEWQAITPLPAGGLAWMSLVGNATAEDSGITITDTAELAYTLSGGGSFTAEAQVASQIPNFPPFIAWPENGEFCLSRAGNVEVRGLARPGAAIEVYEDGVLQAGTTADASGTFTTTYAPAHWAADAPVALTARDCTLGTCGSPSNAVTVRAPDNGWCPQRSVWEGVLGGKTVRRPFRNAAGEMATSGWGIPSVHYGHTGNRVVIYECTSPLAGHSVSNIAVEVDGITYEDGDGPDGEGAWAFDVGSGHSISVIVSTQQTNGASGPTYITWGTGPLIDPDGFIFDVTKGFDVISSTVEGVPVEVGNTIAGITVTAMVSMPQWGGWVPWPAHLYNDQVNPQVTGEDGYFAFFTPPGFYYLQVDAIAGYQSWRSPVVQVINDIVHVNVPCTPLAAGGVTSLDLTPDGPGRSVITVTAGSGVEWVSSLGANASIEDLARDRENPPLRLLSDLNPLNDVLGWDSGMLAPGSPYRRRFTRPGTYTYTDGAGHSGQVVVTSRICLPLALRGH